MNAIRVEQLEFIFPAEWTVGRYDDWSYYRRQFARMWNSIKGVDLLAVDESRTAWFIEVKDYRQQERVKSMDLAEEVAHKVFDTLAAMLPAAIHGNDVHEVEVAQRVCQASCLRVILHLEQPEKRSYLRPRAIDPATIQQRLRHLLKPIDAHPRVVESARMGSLPWSVT